ncbi:MAG: hypothetical protein AVDCRST_MAG85-4381, partial [uncultured Solirubrobacteraceae bacterium]
VRSTQRLRSVRVTLRMRGRTVATGQASSLSGRKRVSLRVRRGLRRGTALLRLTAVDPSGKRINVSRRVRLTR